MTFRLLDGSGRELERRDWTVTVHSLDECVIESGSEEMKESQPSVVIFAAYVNGNHLLIDWILKTALDWKLVTQVLRPQAPDEATERREVAALWRTLQALGVRDSTVARVATGTPSVKNQNVCFLDEALDSTQANCVDGRVLLASIFLRLGLEPELLLVPGHCFLKAKYPHSGDVFLETTVLDGGVTLKQSQASAVKRYKTAEKRFDVSEGYARVNLREARATIQPLRSRRGTVASK